MLSKHESHEVDVVFLQIDTQLRDHSAAGSSHAFAVCPLCTLWRLMLHLEHWLNQLVVYSVFLYLEKVPEVCGDDNNSITAAGMYVFVIDGHTARAIIVGGKRNTT